jgi:hypothetical protein
MQTRKLIFAIVMLLTATMVSAQSAHLKGQVLDSSGLSMSAAEVKVFQGDKVVQEGKTTTTGEFDLNVPTGDYRLEITAPDFQTYTEMVKVTPDQQPLTITMQVAQVQQVVEVTEEANQISLEADSSLSATVLKGDVIEQLPEDETELEDYLTQIAGARGSAGNGANFVIDGFTNGRIPPRDQIQEIRINNNPYSTEFSGIGFGRVEIVTKPGTGQFHGNLNLGYRDDAFNARDPFSPEKPSYQARSLQSNFGGPVIQNRLTVNVNARNYEQDNSDTIRAVLPTGPLSQPVVRPSVNRGATLRSQLAFTKTNTLYMNVEYQKNKSDNQGVGSSGGQGFGGGGGPGGDGGQGVAANGGQFNLAERAYNSRRNSSELQVRDVAILSPKVIHEVRFNYRRNRSDTIPITQGIRGLNVLDSFYSGSAQNLASNNNRSYELGNMLMYSGSKWTIRTGSQNVFRRDRSFSENNFLGTFTFSSLDDYLAGQPITYTQTVGNPLLSQNQFEGAAFIQNDWRVSRIFNLQFGARYENQTNVKDNNNVDPRMGFALSLGKNMALRAGAGTFHQRLDLNTVEQLIRLNGLFQQQIVIRNPTYPDPFLVGAQSAVPPSIRVRAQDLATPYTISTSISLERSLPKGLGVTLSWDTVRGMHLFRSRNINAPLPDTFVRPDLTQSNIYQLESTGLARANNFTLGFRQNLRNRWNLNIFGNYTLGFQKNDTDGAFSLPADNYDLHSEWGRSANDLRHRFNAGINFRAPWQSNVILFLNANSARPFNITTGTDDNHDTNVNDRPAGVTRNTGNGPSNFWVNMNFQKSIRLKHPESPPGNSRASNPYANSFAEPQRGGPAGGGGGGAQRGGGGYGGQRGNQGGGVLDQPQRGGNPGNFGQPSVPQLQFVVEIQNLLNTPQLNNYSGVLTSPFFEKATGLARRPRQIQLGMRFQF